MRTPRHLRVFLFFLFVCLSSASGQAQDDPDALAGPELGELDAMDEDLWDTSWDFGAIADPGVWALNLAVGRRTSSEEVTQARSSSARTARQIPARNQMENYAYASLQFPLEALWTGARRAAHVPRNSSESSSLARNLGEDAFREGTAEESSGAHGPFELAELAKTASDAHPAPDSGAVGASPNVPEVREELTDQRTRSPSPVGAPAALSARADALKRQGAGASGSTKDLLMLVREVSARVVVGFDAESARLRGLVRRSRWSGLAPELRLRGVYGFDRATSSEESLGIYPGDTTTRGSQDSLAEVRLTFRLDRLVLGSGEDSLEKQRSQLASDRRKLVKEAILVLMEWRGEQWRSEDSSLLPEERREAAFGAELALAELYLLTGGWFRGAATISHLALRWPELRSDGPNE